MNNCFICGSNIWIERHHVFGASRKKASEKYGMLCVIYVTIATTNHQTEYITIKKAELDYSNIFKRYLRKKKQERILLRFSVKTILTNKKRKRWRKND
jgi:hypothetical protein